jgi:hypothetical protein
MWVRDGGGKVQEKGVSMYNLGYQTVQVGRRVQRQRGGTAKQRVSERVQREFRNEERTDHEREK